MTRMSAGQYEFEMTGVLGPLTSSLLADLEVEHRPASTRLLLNEATVDDLLSVLAAIEQDGHEVERIIVERIIVERIIVERIIVEH